MFYLWTSHPYCSLKKNHLLCRIGRLNMRIGTRYSFGVTLSTVARSQL